MAGQARVTSLDALEKFRADLIVFVTTAHRCVDEVGDEVRRTRGWLQTGQRVHWDGELRRRKRGLEAAEQELFSAKLSGLKDSMAMYELAVQKARRATTEAEDKLANVKKWNRNFESAAGPLVKRIEALRHLLDHDLPKALAFLVQAQRTLEAYSETTAPKRSEPA